jgi:hypothetical protein
MDACSCAAIAPVGNLEIRVLIIGEGRENRCDTPGPGGD